LNFTVSNGGRACLHYESTAGNIKLVVGGQTVTVGGSRAEGEHLTCPDGATYTTATPVSLLNCGADDAGPDQPSIPAGSWAATPTAASFELSGLPDNGALPVFYCTS
jgi:hypothetical protein